MGFLVNIVTTLFFSCSLKKFLTILSSNEWNDITANLPPGANISMAWGSAFAKPELDQAALERAQAELQAMLTGLAAKPNSNPAACGSHRLKTSR